MKRFIAFLLAMWPALALADATVPSLAPATSLFGASTYLAQPGAGNNQLGFLTSTFCLNSGALTICPSAISGSMLGPGAALSNIGAGSISSSYLAPTGVTPGSYTNLNATIGADGRVTAASNGSGGGGGGTPGGSNGQVQYNNSGAFGGFTFSGGVTVNPSTGVAVLGNPGPSTLGGIESVAQVGGEFVQYIDTSGVPHLATPSGGGNVTGPGSSVNNDLACFNGTSGTLLADCGILSTNVVTPTSTNTLTNKSISAAEVNSGNLAAAQMSANLSAAIDTAVGSTQGDIAYRNATVWTVLPPGTSGQFLETQGASANPLWGTPSGSGNMTGSGAATTNDLIQANNTGTPLNSATDTGIPTSSVVTLTGTQTLTNKTLTTPTINGAALSGTVSGGPTFSGQPTFSNALTGTQANCLGTSSGGVLVASSGACGSGGSTTITLATPGIGSSSGTYNPGTQTVTNGSSIFLQGPFYHANTTSCTLNSTCVGGSTNDSGYLLTPTAASVTYTAPNPGTVGSSTYNFGYDGTHSYSITTVGGTATFYGACGAGATTASALTVPVTILTDGTNYQCFPNGGSGGGSGTVTSVGLSVPATSIFAATGSPVTTAGTLGLTTTGTSGGIPYFSSTSQLVTSALLTAHGVVLGEGVGTAPATTSAGTSGQVLTSNGASADPTFQAAAGASSALNQITSGTTNTLASITTTFTTEVWLSASSGAKTDNVPGCVSGLNKDFLIEQDGQGTAGTNAITVTPASGTIGPNGTASYVMAANGAATFFQCDGTSTTWRLVASNQPGSAVRYASGTTLTVGANDNGNVISQSNASAVAATIAQAGTTGFPNGSYYTIIQNTGAGAVTLTPTTSTINGVATMVLPAGSTSAPTGALIYADNAGNYIGLPFGSGGSSAFNAITSGTNTTAAMVVGSGGSLAVSGSGTIAATSAPASGLTGSTLASGVTGSSLTSVGTLTSLTVGGSAATTPSALTMSASTVATNAALSNVFTGTMVHADSPYTFSNPTGLVSGQSVTYVLTESSTGGDTVGTWGGNFAFPSGTPVFNPTANAVNLVSCQATSSSALQCFGPSYPATNTQSGTTYTFAAADCGKTVIFTSNSAVTATIPASIVPASGTMCLIGVIQAGTAKDSVNGSAVSPATLISSHSYTGTSGTAGSTIALALTTISAATDAFLTGDGS